MFNEDYFILNGENSLEKGITVIELPSFTVPKVKFEEIEVLGRDGVYTFTEEAREDTIKKCKVYYNGDDIDSLVEFLRDGQVIFSNKTDRYYNARIVSEIPIDELFRNNDYGAWYEFYIDFKCEPYGRFVDNEVITITEKESIIYNQGIKSEPVITIYGNGNINLFVNGNQLTLKEVDGYITVDTHKKRTTKGLERQNEKKIGNFPKLDKGENLITWDGSVSKIEIIPNFRYLV